MPAFLAGTIKGDGPFDFTDHVLRAIEQLGIDALAAIGGDDTLSYALRLHDEGVPVIAIPKTMDNDVHGTDYCIGFSTAVTRGVQFIHNLRTSAGSHERIAVVELFGRYSGETSLITAYLAGVDRAIISEVPFDIHHLAELMLHDKAQNPSRYAMPTVSEGATATSGELVLGEADAYGHRKLGGIGLLLGEALAERTGEDIIYQQLAYLMRSGSPDSLDLMVATNYVVMAADLALEGDTGGMVSSATELHDGSDLRYSRGRQAGRRGRALRRPRVQAEGPARPRQAHVPLLTMAALGVLTGGGDCPGSTRRSAQSCAERLRAGTRSSASATVSAGWPTKKPSRSTGIRSRGSSPAAGPYLARPATTASVRNTAWSLPSRRRACSSSMASSRSAARERCGSLIASSRSTGFPSSASRRRSTTTSPTDVTIGFRHRRAYLHGSDRPAAPPSPTTASWSSRSWAEAQAGSQPPRGSREAPT